MLKDVIEADFAAVLAEGFSATLEIPMTEKLTLVGPVTIDTYRFGILKLPAAVTETTLGAEVEVGGVRAKRTFSATFRRIDLLGTAKSFPRFFCGGDRMPWDEADTPPPSTSNPAPYKLPRPGGIVRMDGELFRIVSLQTSAAAPLATLEFSER